MVRYSFVHPAMLHRQGGMMLLELLIVVSVFGTMATVLINRLHNYREAAEKATMEYTISTLRSVLRMRLSELMIQGRQQESVFFVGQNPMRWLDGMPPNYAGEIDDGAEGMPGHWYFDARTASLVYFVKHSGHFSSALGQPARVRVALVAVPTQGATTTGNSSDSVRLVLQEPYRWDTKH